MSRSPPNSWPAESEKPLRRPLVSAASTGAGAGAVTVGVGAVAGAGVAVATTGAGCANAVAENRQTNSAARMVSSLEKAAAATRGALPRRAHFSKRDAVALSNTATGVFVYSSARFVNACSWRNGTASRDSDGARVGVEDSPLLRAVDRSPLARCLAGDPAEQRAEVLQRAAPHVERDLRQRRLGLAHHALREVDLRDVALRDVGRAGVAQPALEIARRHAEQLR